MTGDTKKSTDNSTSSQKTYGKGYTKHLSLTKDLESPSKDESVPLLPFHDSAELRRSPRRTLSDHSTIKVEPHIKSGLRTRSDTSEERDRKKRTVSEVSNLSGKVSGTSASNKRKRGTSKNSEKPMSSQDDIIPPNTPAPLEFDVPLVEETKTESIACSEIDYDILPNQIVTIPLVSFKSSLVRSASPHTFLVRSASPHTSDSDSSNKRKLKATARKTVKGDSSTRPKHELLTEKERDLLDKFKAKNFLNAPALGTVTTFEIHEPNSNEPESSKSTEPVSAEKEVTAAPDKGASPTIQAVNEENEKNKWARSLTKYDLKQASVKQAKSQTMNGMELVNSLIIPSKPTGLTRSSSCSPSNLSIPPSKTRHSTTPATSKQSNTLKEASNTDDRSGPSKDTDHSGVKEETSAATNQQPNGQTADVKNPGEPPKQISIMALLATNLKEKLQYSLKRKRLSVDDVNPSDIAVNLPLKHSRIGDNSIPSVQVIQENSKSSKFNGVGQACDSSRYQSSEENTFTLSTAKQKHHSKISLENAESKHGLLVEKGNHSVVCQSTLNVLQDMVEQIVGGPALSDQLVKSFSAATPLIETKTKGAGPQTKETGGVKELKHTSPEAMDIRQDVLTESDSVATRELPVKIPVSKIGGSTLESDKIIETSHASVHDVNDDGLLACFRSEAGVGTDSEFTINVSPSDAEAVAEVCVSKTSSTREPTVADLTLGMSFDLVDQNTTVNITTPNALSTRNEAETDVAKTQAPTTDGQDGNQIQDVLADLSVVAKNLLQQDTTTSSASGESDLHKSKTNHKDNDLKENEINTDDYRRASATTDNTALDKAMDITETHVEFEPPPSVHVIGPILEAPPSVAPISGSNPDNHDIPHDPVGPKKAPHTIGSVEPGSHSVENSELRFINHERPTDETNLLEVADASRSTATPELVIGDVMTLSNIKQVSKEESGNIATQCRSKSTDSDPDISVISVTPPKKSAKEPMLDMHGSCSEVSPSLMMALNSSKRKDVSAIVAHRKQFSQTVQIYYGVLSFNLARYTGKSPFVIKCNFCGAFFGPLDFMTHVEPGDDKPVSGAIWNNSIEIADRFDGPNSHFKREFWNLFCDWFMVLSTNIQKTNQLKNTVDGSAGTSKRNKVSSSGSSASFNQSSANRFDAIPPSPSPAFSNESDSLDRLVQSSRATKPPSAHQSWSNSSARTHHNHQPPASRSSTSRTPVLSNALSSSQTSLLRKAVPVTRSGSAGSPPVQSSVPHRSHHNSSHDPCVRSSHHHRDQFMVPSASKARTYKTEAYVSGQPVPGTTNVAMVTQPSHDRSMISHSSHLSGPANVRVSPGLGTSDTSRASFDPAQMKTSKNFSDVFAGMRHGLANIDMEFARLQSENQALHDEIAATQRRHQQETEALRKEANRLRQYIQSLQPQSSLSFSFT